MSERRIVTDPEKLREIGKLATNDRVLLDGKTDELWEQIDTGCCGNIASALKSYDPDTQDEFLRRVLERARFPSAGAISYFLVELNTTDLPQKGPKNRTFCKEEVRSLFGLYLGIEDEFKVKFTETTSYLNEIDDAETERLLAHCKETLSEADRERGLSARRIRAIDSLLGRIVADVDQIGTTITTDYVSLYERLIDLGVVFAAREQLSEDENPGLKAMRLAQQGIVPLGISSEPGSNSAKKTLIVYLHNR